MSRKLWVAAVIALLAIVATRVTYEFGLRYAPGVSPAEPSTVKVACIGDSITFGMLVRRAQTYPGMLQQMLGDGYSVRNFGANGHTLQKQGDSPYWQHPYFKAGSDFAPDIVLIMLGTNDSKPQNWKGIAAFLQDYRGLIAHYRALPSQPAIYLLTPASAFVLEGKGELKFEMNAVAIEEIAEGVKALGDELGLPVIDINAVTASHADYFAFDGIHPNAAGAALIAEAAGREILQRQIVPQPNVPQPNSAK